MELSIEPSVINDMTSYTKNGITHVYILDTGTAYELINGEWVEKAPF